jgi:hypothetical protein
MLYFIFWIKTMAAPALAKTTFASGADDSLRVKDVYGEGGGGVVNSYTEEHPSNIDILEGIDGSAGGGANEDDDPILDDSDFGDAPDVGTIGGALEGTGDEADDLAQRIGEEWLEKLLLPNIEDAAENAADFIQQHNLFLQEAIQKQSSCI